MNESDMLWNLVFDLKNENKELKERIDKLEKIILKRESSL